MQKYGLEDLFYRYGVDIIIGAHEHTYERLFPVYDRQVFNGSAEEPYRNPKAPIHLLVGSAGCQEEVDPFVSKPEHWSAKRISDYGITEFHVLNKTHIRVRQRSTVKVKYMFSFSLKRLLNFLFAEWSSSWRGNSNQRKTWSRSLVVTKW